MNRVRPTHLVHPVHLVHIQTRSIYGREAVCDILPSIFNLIFLQIIRNIRSRLYNVTSKFNKQQHMVQNYLDLARKLGVKYNTNKLVPLVVSEKDRKAPKAFIKKNKLKGFVVGLIPGVAESVKYRMWPEDKMAELADQLVKKLKAKVVFIDAPSNKGK